MLFNRFALAESRRLRGMTKAQVADAAHKSRPYLTQLEGDVRGNPTMQAVRDLAAALEIDPRALYVDLPYDRLLEELVEKLNGDRDAIEAAITRLVRLRELGK